MTAESVPYEREQFETVAEVEVDSRGRVSLGKAGAEPGRRYRVQQRVDGVLLLIPVVSIPEREMVVWRNPELAAEIRPRPHGSRAGAHDRPGQLRAVQHRRGLAQGEVQAEVRRPQPPRR